TGALDLDLERPDAMFGGLAARVFRRDLRGIGRRLAAALETHHPGRAPGNCIALRVGDRDHGVVEAGVHVSHAGRNVLALPPADALRCLGHLFPTILSKLLRTSRTRKYLLLLASDRLGLALAGARVGVRALATDREALAMTKPAVAGEVHQPLNVHCGIAAKIALDVIVAVDRL